MPLYAEKMMFAFIMLISVSLLSQAYGQEISVLTSADEHENAFFGESVLQVVIDDPNADDDDTQETLSVDIDADPATGTGASGSFDIPETSDSSGRFELYLVHADATAVTPANLDPINTAGVEGDGNCVSGCATIVTFGPSGELQVDADLYEDVTFAINVNEEQVTVNYEQDLAQVSLDRSSYGSDSFVYVFIDDQDANLNPTRPDEFAVDPDVAPNGDLLDLQGGSIESAITFRETGDNTAIFEARYELGSSMTFDTESLVLTLSDKANYGDTLAADENDSASTDEVSFSIGDQDGTIDVGGGQPTWDAKLSSGKPAYSLGENITITVEDREANANSATVDNIDLEISASNISALITATETGQNTGIFTSTFLLASDGTVAGTGLALGSGDPILVSYVDEKPAEYQQRLDRGQDPKQEFTLEIETLSVVLGTDSTSVSAPTVARVSAGPIIAGGQLGLATTVENNMNSEQSFVSLIEVRNSAGVTVYIAWQSGSLKVGGSAPIQVSWTPQVSGEYEVRMFTVSSLSDPAVLSEVATTRVAVS
jgi:hypothetical protein